MAIGVLFEIPGGTQRQYDAIMRDMHLGGKLPPGALSHVAGPTPRGWRVVDVWESEQAFERFAREQILPLAQKHGVPPFDPQVFPIHNTLKP
jgi:hypothetical protein